MRLSALIVASAVLAAACSTTQQVAAHRARLLAAAAPEVPLDVKRDALAESAVAMMHEAVDRLDPRRGAKYVEAYAKTNGPLVDSLAGQIERGVAELPRGERIAFGLEVLAKPYFRDASALLPRFAARYEHIRAVSSLTGDVKRAVTGEAAGRLDGLLRGGG